MATIKEIAELAGVSRGTVDRVLNLRGGVDAETEARVRRVMERLDYHPNRAARSLAAKKKNLRLGLVLFDSGERNPFFIELLDAARRETAALAEYGVTVELRFSGLEDGARQVRLLRELAESGVNGVAISPVNSPMVAATLRELAEGGVAVVTVNTDLPDSGRLCYVGSDYRRSGETAGGLLRLLCAGEAQVGTVTGSENVLCHSERVAGLRSALSRAPGLRYTETVEGFDDDAASFRATAALLVRQPDLTALYIAAGGVSGAARAVAESGRRMTIVANDRTPATRRLVCEGVVAATIGQDPETQGTLPLRLLFDVLAMGILPEREYYYTPIEIYIGENI